VTTRARSSRAGDQRGAVPVLLAQPPARLAALRAAGPQRTARPRPGPHRARRRAPPLGPRRGARARPARRVAPADRARGAGADHPQPRPRGQAPRPARADARRPGGARARHRGVERAERQQARGALARGGRRPARPPQEGHGGPMRRTALAALLVAALAPAAAAQGAGSSPAAEATVTGPTGAATEGALAPLLARSHQHPAVLAAQAALDAARAQLQAARSPVRLEVTGGVTRLDVDEIDVNPLEPGVQPLERTLLNASAGVTFRPFAFGDIADLVDQREVAVAQAELDLRSALVSVQVRTLEAALQLELARAGVAVAEEGAALAREALAATELRASRGAATERDLREARSGVAEAESLVADAHSSLELAELSLRTLLGDGEPPAVDPAAFDLPLPEGEPVEVIRAGLQARLAELAPRGAQRALLPVAQASYAFNLGEHDTLTLSLESRTLQPGVTFTHDAIGRSFPQTEV